MRRSELLIILGCVWTLYTAFSITTSQVAGPLSTSLLTIGVILSGLLWFSCGLSGGKQLTPIANLMHVGLSGLWLSWAQAGNATLASTRYSPLIILSLAIGVVLANVGAASIHLEPSPLSDIDSVAPYDLESARSVYESGGFHSPILSACDSGGFRVP